jgi:hypothetical protein
MTFPPFINDAIPSFVHSLQNRADSQAVKGGIRPSPFLSYALAGMFIGARSWL